MVTATDSQTQLPVVFFLGSDGGVWSLWRLTNHSEGGWSDLVFLEKPDSNLTAIDVTADEEGILNVFGLTETGEIYRIIQAKPTKSSSVVGCVKPAPPGRPTPCTEFSSWISVNSQFSAGTKGFQALTAGSGTISLFGVANEMAYEIREVAPEAGLFATLEQIPSKHSMESNFIVAANGVTGLFEGFARRSNSKNLQRTWQDSSSAWTDKWDEPGTFPPDLDSNPVVIVKPDGLLEIYIRDGDEMHTLREKSCKSSGDCDYGSWNELPKHDKTSSANSWGLTTLIGGGTEVVLRGDDGNIYRIYQDSQDGKWDKWESLGTPGSATLVSQPLAVQNGNGVTDILVGRTDGSISFFVGPNTIKVEPDVVADDDTLTVSWNIAADVAAKEDQIRLYPIGEEDVDKYVMTTYVNGETSPGKNPVPIGSYTFSDLYFPEGTYEARYVSANQHFVASEPFQQFSNGGSVTPLNKMFKGLVSSLGVSGADPVACLSSSDTEAAYEDFNVGFTNYSTGAVIEGLQNIGQGLTLFANSLIACDKPQVGNSVQIFAQDMVACTADSCIQFNTTLPGETIYASRHNIDSDLSTASSNWLSEKYEESGVLLGLSVAACSYWPSS